MDRSILLIVKKFDRYRISTNQNKKDGRWNSKIYYAIYSKTNLTGNDIVTFRPTYLEPRSFILVFKTPLSRYRTQRRKYFLFVLSSRRENAIESRNPRIDHPWLYTGNRAPRRNSRPAVIFFYPWRSLRWLS